MDRKKEKKIAKLIQGFSGYEGSKKSYCEQHKIKPHVFDYYRKKLKGDMEGQPKFLPIQIKESKQVERIELYYPNGNQVRLSADTPITILKQLLQINLPKK